MLIYIFKKKRKGERKTPADEEELRRLLDVRRRHHFSWRTTPPVDELDSSRPHSRQSYIIKTHKP